MFIFRPTVTSMKFKEKRGNLFSCQYALGHCVSQDLKMSKGIAKQFKVRYPNIQTTSNNFSPHLTVLETGTKFIYNLITKKKNL